MFFQVFWYPGLSSTLAWSQVPAEEKHDAAITMLHYMYCGDELFRFCTKHTVYCRIISKMFCHGCIRPYRDLLHGLAKFPQGGMIILFVCLFFVICSQAKVNGIVYDV